MTDQEWDAWIDQLRGGDKVALNECWDQYGASLVRLAERNLVEQLRRRVDPEDVVQSAFRTFLRRVQAGEFEMVNSDGLWSLLSAITLNKARMAARRHLSQKRSMGREVALDKIPGSRLSHNLELPDPSPEDAAALVDLVDSFTRELEPIDQSVFALKLDGCSNDEIADRLECSERSVRRIQARLRQKLTRLLDS